MKLTVHFSFTYGVLRGLLHNLYNLSPVYLLSPNLLSQDLDCWWGEYFNILNFEKSPFFWHWILWRVTFSNTEFCEMSVNGFNFPPRQTPLVLWQKICNCWKKLFYMTFHSMWQILWLFSSAAKFPDVSKLLTTMLFFMMCREGKSARIFQHCFEKLHQKTQLTSIYYKRIKPAFVD